MRFVVLVSTALLTVTAACGGDDGDTASSGGGEVGEALGTAVPDESATTSTTAPGPTTTSTPLTTPPTTIPTPVPLAVTDVAVPDTGADGIDACSQPTSYDSANLVDGYTDTAWRMPGDASGQTLTFQLDGSHRVLRLAVLPGYAKVDPCDGADRWPENRRPVTVTWQFDDGSEVTQTLDDTPTLQQVTVDVTTSTVSLRIDGVTADPMRDFTAVSEVIVYGT